MVFKNTHDHKTAGLWWQRSMFFICLVLLALWWDSEPGSVCVYVTFLFVSRLFSSFPLGLGRPSKVLAGAKRFARDIDFTRSLHHSLIYVTIIQNHIKTLLRYYIYQTKNKVKLLLKFPIWH